MKILRETTRLRVHRGGKKSEKVHELYGITISALFSWFSPKTAALLEIFFHHVYNVKDKFFSYLRINCRSSVSIVNGCLYVQCIHKLLDCISVSHECNKNIVFGETTH